MVPAQATGSGDSVEFTVVPGPVGFGAGPEGAEPPSVPGEPLGVEGSPVSLPGTIAMSTRMASYAVTDASGSGEGWSISVSGARGPGRSPVLRQYCPSAGCGGDPGPGYVSNGLSLPANSLALDSSGAEFHSQWPGSGAPPVHSCDRLCFIDARGSLPSKIAVAAMGAGIGAFKATGFEKDSFRFVGPVEPGKLPRGQRYRVDVGWSLNTGP
jgi:hypothetical protein